MNTKVWLVDKYVDNIETYPQIAQAAEMLQQNEVVAFPTETVYGLGGNANSDEAVRKIFAAKGRPSDNPLIIHIANKEQLTDFVEQIPYKAQQLMEAFWPGPLTIIFNKREGKLSSLATAGLDTVAVRMPDHPVALALLEKTRLPIAAPSANRSGKPSPTTAEHVLADLNGIIAGVVNGDATGVGVESTVIDCTEEIPIVLRPGGVTKEEIEEVIGEVRIDPALTDKSAAPKSPGMKYRHYAPNAPFVLVNGSREFLQSLVNEHHKKGERVGVLTTAESLHDYDADVVIACGERHNLATVAAQLYSTLREFNETNVDLILSETFPSTGVGHAIMNRLLKAAGHKIISE